MISVVKLYPNSIGLTKKYRKTKMMNNNRNPQMNLSSSVILLHNTRRHSMYDPPVHLKK